MSSDGIRALVTGAGTGAAANLVRALRGMIPAPHIVGVNDDRFALRQSSADRNYLCPAVGEKPFVDSILELVRRDRLNVIIPTDDHIVKALSDARTRFPVGLLLPRRQTIDLCQDKFALSEFFRGRNIPVPRTYAVRSLRGLDAIFARFRSEKVVWCRARHGARALGAAPVMTVEQARAWITLWRDLRGLAVSDFTVSEYLPGRHYIVMTLWHDGRLLRAQPTEVLGYFGAGNNPSGIFSLSCLAKTVVADQALQTALRAVRALERRPTGGFSVELKETAGGVPAITEINAGRFPAGVAALLAMGKDNMIALLAVAAAGKPRVAAQPLGTPEEYYLVRDIDAEPGVFSAAEAEGCAREEDPPRRRGRRRV
jgi:carbamoyl-phosphate synthase large subunit